MQLQTIEIEGKTYALVSDGKPLYKADDGKDVPFDAPAAVGTITRITAESKDFKTRAQAAETSLKAFDGIADPAAAKKALETVSSLDQKKLIDAGEAQRVRDEIAKGYEGKISEADQRFNDLQARYNGEKIKGAFAGSKFIAEKVHVPADMLQATFGSRFNVGDDGQVIAVDAAGQPIGSNKKFGEPADFEEAIERLIEAYPYKDTILKGTGAAGSGATGATGGGAGPKTMPRAQFETLSQPERAAKMKEGFTLTE
jgi:hypothetical protein